MSTREIMLAAALSCVVAAGCARTQAKPAAPAPEEVLVSLPSSDEITDYEEFIGHTDAIYSVEVRARVNGYLDKVNFTDGTEVEKGTVLAEIDARPYKATYDNQAAMVEQGKAHLITTSANHRRAEALLQRTAIGREEYDRIQGDFAESKATIGAAVATLDMAQLNLDWTKVTAPISGLLSRRMVDPGNLIKADETLITTIVSLDPIYVYFDIDERTLLKIRRLIAEGRVKSRRDAELPVLIGLSDETDFPHPGTINFSDNKLDASTGTLRIRGVIPNPSVPNSKSRLFSPGLFVRIRLPIGSPHKSILVAEQAIGTDQGRKYVYVVKTTKVPDKKTNTERDAEVVAYRPVTVGSLNNGLRVVNTGLELGERVVVSGLQRVRPGKEVAPRMISDVEKGEPSKPAAQVAEHSETKPATPSIATPTAAAAQPAATH